LGQLVREAPQVQAVLPALAESLVPLVRKVLRGFLDRRVPAVLLVRRDLPGRTTLEDQVKTTTSRERLARRVLAWPPVRPDHAVLSALLRG